MASHVGSSEAYAYTICRGICQHFRSVFMAGLGVITHKCGGSWQVVWGKKAGGGGISSPVLFAPPDAHAYHVPHRRSLPGQTSGICHASNADPECSPSLAGAPFSANSGRRRQVTAPRSFQLYGYFPCPLQHPADTRSARRASTRRWRRAARTRARCAAVRERS